MRNMSDWLCIKLLLNEILVKIEDIKMGGKECKFLKIIIAQRPHADPVDWN